MIPAGVLINKNKAIGLHVISCFEISILVEKGKILLKEDLSDWMARMLSIPKIELLQLTPAQAVRSTTLPGSFHRDPVDRILAATYGGLFTHNKRQVNQGLGVNKNGLVKAFEKLDLWSDKTIKTVIPNKQGNL